MLTELTWSEHQPPDGKTYFYDHITAKTPLGLMVIGWKSWKDYPIYSLSIEGGGDFIESFDSIEAAKQGAVDHLKAEYSKLAFFLGVSSIQIQDKIVEQIAYGLEAFFGPNDELDVKYIVEVLRSYKSKPTEVPNGN